MMKQIKEEDLTECLNVIHRGFGTVAKEFHLTPQNCATNGAFMPLSRLEHDLENGALMFGYTVNDKIEGFIQLSKKDEACYALEKLAVLPEDRHNGYGAQILAFAREKVKELGGKKVVLTIIEENTRLKDWYIKNGFVSLGTKVFPHLPFTVGFMESNV